MSALARSPRRSWIEIPLWLVLALLVASGPVWGSGGVSDEGGGDHETDHESEHKTDHETDHAGEEDAHGHSRLSATPRPLAELPERPKPLLELGEPFLGTGTLKPGFELPTGAVWQPSLLLFGNLRLAFQSFEPDDGSGDRITEIATRLDLFANLQLSGSERLVVGIRATEDADSYTGYFFEHPDPGLEGELRDELDADLEVLFFEGDLGEIFPNLDRRDFGSLDLGFSVGRQQLLFQEGLLINDTIDGIGITRNTLLPGSSPNLRITAFYGWGNLGTSFGAERDGELYALFTSTDLPRSTLDADIAYVRAEDDSGDLLAAGLSAVQRFGRFNSSVRLLGSLATGEETAFSTDGLLLFNELSWDPRPTHDLVYVNTFWAIDRYTPAARGVGGAAAGPLGRAGINFASVDLGSFDAPLSSRAHDVAGGAVGYQRFFDHTRQQLLVELGFRFGTRTGETDSTALTARYQRAFGRRLVVVVDGFVARRELAGGGDEVPYGGRLELVVKF